MVTMAPSRGPGAATASAWPSTVGDARAGRRSPLERAISRLALAGLGVQVLVVVMILASAARVGIEGHRAVTARNAEVAAADLLAGMADQQTGLLTYMKPAQPDSLLLYTLGQQETERSLASLRADTDGTAEAGLSGRVESSVRAWQTWAEELRAQSVAAVVPVTNPVAIATGRRLFATFATSQQDLVARLDARATTGAALTGGATTVAVGVAVGGSTLIAVTLGLFALRVLRRVLNPLGRLAAAAEQVTVEGRASIPHVELANEVGELARALQGWQDASAVRTILVEQAPVGICRIDAEGRFLTANVSCEAMLGYSRDELAGRPFWTFLHPDDAGRASDRHLGLMRGSTDHRETENRWLRKDGSMVWFSVVTVPVRAPDGRPETAISIMEDVTDRKREAERAAWIQRELLPRERPRMDGYELAAACLPAEDVGGDFYDWVGPQDGHLDLTLADVMGHGVGAALVMATLRTALRTTSRELGPAARVSLVAESMSPGLTDDGLFVTLFHARLELGTGLLRYVDAGHGYCVVRRAGGDLVRLAERSLPLGVTSEVAFTEGQIELGPGDTLLAYTDGLVELDDRDVGLEEVTGVLAGAGGAEEMVSRLLGAPREDQGDDVTVVILHRLVRPHEPAEVPPATLERAVPVEAR
jgi:PAS domain S-box-containing protein